MKRILLASAACLSLAFAAAGPAHALFGEGDIVFDPTAAERLADQIRQMQQQYEVMKQQYGQLVQTYDVLSHPNQVMQIAKGMAQQQIQNPGSMPGSIPGLSFGTQLSAGASRFLNQNRYATPQGDDFAAQEMQRRAQATANVQAEAQTGMERADERIDYLNQLQQSIQDQPDVTAVAAVGARVSSEHLFLQNEANNVARLQLVQQTQARVDQQRAAEHDRQSAEDWAKQSAAAAAAAGLTQ